MSKPAVILTESFATVVIDGRNYTITAGHPEFKNARAAIREGRFADIPAMVDRAASINKFGEGKVVVVNGVITYMGQPLHNTTTDIILQMQADGFDITPMVRFLENLMANPSKTSVDELYLFLEHGKMPITDDGCFLAYKRVRGNYYDIHSGTFDNSVGKVCEMPRNQVDDKRDRTCSAGLHFCSFEYLPHFSYRGVDDKIMIVKINPADVVSIPSDYKNTKGRTAKYEVIGEHKGYHVTKDNVLTTTSVVSLTNSTKNADTVNSVVAGGIKTAKVSPDVSSVKVTNIFGDALVTAMLETGDYDFNDVEVLEDFVYASGKINVTKRAKPFVTNGTIAPLLENLARAYLFNEWTDGDDLDSVKTGAELISLYNIVRQAAVNASLIKSEDAEYIYATKLSTSKVAFINGQLTDLLSVVFAAIGEDALANVNAVVQADLPQTDAVKELKAHITKIGAMRYSNTTLKEFTTARNTLADLAIKAGCFKADADRLAIGLTKIVKYSKSCYDAEYSVKQLVSKLKNVSRVKLD